MTTMFNPENDIPKIIRVYAGIPYVAVILTENNYSGWWTAQSSKLKQTQEYLKCLFDPEVVRLIEAGDRASITEDWCKSRYGKDFIYLCDVSYKLDIIWIPQGTRFTVQEYDGIEYLVTQDMLSIVA